MAITRHTKPVLTQRIFEARYDRGYRYFDHCGQAMIIAEEALTDSTKCEWFPDRIAPTGARLKCPELDMVIAFDASRFVLDQNPVLDVQCDFSGIAEEALAIIKGRFGLEQWRRLGCRRIEMLPANTLDDAANFTTSLLPIRDWRAFVLPELSPRSYEIDCVFEGGSDQGIRISAKAVAKITADVEIDERLKQPPRLQHTKQREALVEQLKRRRQQAADPEAGVLLDMDYYWLWPDPSFEVISFVEDGWKKSEKLRDSLLHAEERSS